MAVSTERGHLYIFLDEGGNLDFSPGGTRYFTMTAVSARRPIASHSAMAELKYGFVELGLDIEYFHAAEDRQAVRDRVFSIIRNELSRMRIDALVVEKRKTGPALRPIEHFYPRMMGYLLRHVVENCDLKSVHEVLVFTDALPLEKKRRAVEKTIKEILARMLPEGTRFRCLHHASKSNFDLQVADYCNWAIYRKWEKGDDRSYGVIASAIRSEFDIFRSGERLYY
jgi:hypothetical protein